MTDSANKHGGSAAKKKQFLFDIKAAHGFENLAMRLKVSYGFFKSLYLCMCNGLTKPFVFLYGKIRPWVNSLALFLGNLKKVECQLHWVTDYIAYGENVL